MFHVIANLFAKPAMSTAAKVALGVAGVSTAAYLLRRSGGDKKVVESVAKTGTFVTGCAVVATGTVLDTGCLVADTALTAAEVTADAALKGVETIGYGVGRSARAVLDVTSKAGKSVSGNPLSRGVMAGFYAPEAQAQQPVVVEGAISPDFDIANATA
jgi:hypothetical protein